MKILFLAYSYCSKNVASERAKAWVNNSKNYYYVVTASERTMEYKEKNNKIFEYRNRLKNAKVVKNFSKKKSKISFFKSIVRDFLFVPDKDIWWILSLIPRLIKIVKKNKIDLILATGDPFSMFIGAFLLAKLTKLPFVIDYRDPWLNESANKQTFIRFLFSKFFEKKIIKSANGVIATTKHILNSVPIANQNNTKVILTGFTNNKFALPEYKKNDKDFWFVYTGKFDFKRPDYNPILVIKGFNEFSKDHKDCYLILVGNVTDEMKKFVVSLDNNNIIITGRLKKENAIGFQKKGDVLLHFYYPSFHTDTISYKIFEYLQHRKPILSFNKPKGELYSFIKNNNFGKMYKIDNVVDVKEGFKYMYYNYNKYKSKSYNFFSTSNQVRKLDLFLERILDAK